MVKSSSKIENIYVSAQLWPCEPPGPRKTACKYARHIDCFCLADTGLNHLKHSYQASHEMQRALLNSEYFVSVSLSPRSREYLRLGQLHPRNSEMRASRSPLAILPFRLEPAGRKRSQLHNIGLLVTHLWAKNSLPDNLGICDRLAPHRVYIWKWYSITYDMTSCRHLPRWQCPVANN